MSTYSQNAGHPYASDDLSLPLYGATVGQAWSRFFRKYATFRGRASRSEFWWWFLIALAVNVVLKIIDIAGSGGSWSAASRSVSSVGDIIGYVWGLAIFIPGLAVYVRRLHDTNRSGLSLLIVLIPVVGLIILLVFVAGTENPEGDRFD